MKIMFLIIPLIYTGANVYLYLRAMQALTCLPLWGKIVFSALFWIVAFALFFAIGLRESKLPETLMQTFFSAGSVWMVFLLYSVLLLLVADLIKLAVPSMGHSFWYALPITCIILLVGHINYRNPKMEHIEVNTCREFSGKDLRIVAISDVHLGYGTGIGSLKKYVQLINDQQPDAVLIVGDLIDNSIKPLLGKPFDKVLSSIEAPMGIYMVPGNHEYISGFDKVANYLKRTPITILRDSIATLPNGIQIIGRDDHSNKSRKSVAELMAMADATKPTIVLDHQPRCISETASLMADILLCGHTHHGQVFPLNIATDYMFEQGHGYRKWLNTHVWVSSGISLWGPQFRIGTNSDFAVINIKHAK